MSDTSADPETPQTAAADTMPKRLGLAEMRTSPHVSLPRRSYSLCLATGLIAEMRSLSLELADHETAAPGDAEETEGKPATRHGGKPTPPRVLEIRARMGELRVLMDEHTGELVLEAWEPDKWTQFCDQHPARDEPAAAKRKDEVLGLGAVNVDALLASLKEFVLTWNDQPLDAGDWEFICSKSGKGDLNAIAQLVATMHEAPVDLPKLRSGLRASLAS